MLLSVVIPSKNDPQGLYFTCAASQVDLASSFHKSEYEIIAVNDGPANETFEGFKMHSTCRVIEGDFDGPQNARHAGLRAATGQYVVFLDSHVVPSSGMFLSLLDAIQRTNGMIVHAPHAFWNEKNRCYAYLMDFGSRFWVSQTDPNPRSPDPYRVACMAHGAFMVDRKKYLRIGGYGTLLRGWGGEEPYLNLKAWMMGESCWVDPRCYHWHYMTMRRTDEIYRHRDYVRNFMLAAYVAGGLKYLNAVHLLHTMASNGKATLEEAAKARSEPFRDIWEAIPKEAHAERAVVEGGPWQGNLDRLRVWFTEQGIPQ